MLAETICTSITDAIGHRIGADFDDYRVTTSVLDKKHEAGSRLRLEIAERTVTTAENHGARPPIVTIEVECECVGLWKYESVVYARLSLDEVAADNLRRLCLEDILKRHQAMEPEITTTTRQGISRANVAQFASAAEQQRGGEREIFVHRSLNVSFTIARITMGLRNLLANGPKEVFEDVAKVTAEGLHALREIDGTLRSKQPILVAIEPAESVTI